MDPIMKAVGTGWTMVCFPSLVIDPFRNPYPQFSNFFLGFFPHSFRLPAIIPSDELIATCSHLATDDLCGHRSFVLSARRY